MSKIWKLNVMPALEVSHEYFEQEFTLYVEVLAAKDFAASLLLAMQDDIGCMPDRSNCFTIYKLEGNEWVELED